MEEGLQPLGAGYRAHLFEQDVGKLVILLGIEGIALFGEMVDQRGPAYVAPLLAGLH